MRTHDRQRRKLWALAAAGILGLTGTACKPPPVRTIPRTTTAPATTRPGAVVTPPPLAKLTCAVTGTVTVNAVIAPRVKSLIAAAKTKGVNLCGGGYRDATAQIATRKRNCGTTFYDIYQKPSSQCSPPTAIPGTSMHEQGLAIDWTNCSTRSSACYVWLAANASTYGLKNLPSEPWHWSSNGR